MKIKKIIASVLLIAFILIFSIGYTKYRGLEYLFSPQAPQYLVDEQINIIATWISEDDINYKLEFKNDGTCIEYYGSLVTDTFNYNISNITPQCGISVLVDQEQETSYLQLVNSDGSTYCYEINGVGELLSLTKVGTAELSIFFK